MTQYIFHPNFSVACRVPGHRSIAELEQERGVYSATPEFVRTHCGPIANELLDCIPQSYYTKCGLLGLHINIDIRIHRLYPGDFPAYPGWHCDGEFRETYFSQPDLDRLKVSDHLCCTISSHSYGVSNTQFLAEPFHVEVEPPDEQHTLWGQIDRLLCETQRKTLFDSTDGEFIHFDSWTLHRCMPAKIRGWRLFFRCSMWHRPNLGDGGKITKQEQVYKLVEGSGW